MVRLTRKHILFAAILAVAGVLAAPVQAALDVVVSETGQVSLSADGVGSNSAAGATISVEKPGASATVRSAYLTCASTFGSSLGNGEVQLDGDPSVWDDTFLNGAYTNVFDDVTVLVAAKVDPAAPGIVDFTLTETFVFNVDGCGLYVIFDDPSQPDNTIFILYGGQESTGDDFAIGLADPIGPTDTAEFGLAISFSAQDQSGNGGSPLCGTESNMFSQIDVNGQRLSTCAGNLDDGVGTVANGNLITVGGLGDDPANPTDPFQTPLDGNPVRIVEDELYNLNPFLGPTDTSVFVATLNPSDDDNIFAGHFIITGTAIVGEGILLSPPSAQNPVGTDHTVTATVQDDDGNPVAGRDVDFEVVSGPNAGDTGSDTTDGDGKATFSYTGDGGPGVDTIVACFEDSQGETQCATATKEWIDDQPNVCDVDTDGDVDRFDIKEIFQRRGLPSPPSSPDLDGDGFVTVLDARLCALQCDFPSCQEPSTRPPTTKNNGGDK